jgi:Tol biopolymer transport system component
VYSAKLDGTDERRLTTDPGRDRQPACSPRGDHIAFVSDREGVQQLFVMNADGSNPRRLTSDTAAADNPAWSSDGLEIVWYSQGAGRRDRLHLSLADGSMPRVIPTTDAGAIYPSFLPNGRVLYAALTPAGRKLLTSVGTDGGGQAIVGGIETFYARATRDGRRIAFITGNWPHSRVGVARADGSAARVLIGDPAP